MKSYEADPLNRFSSRVDNYIKYRPGYPPEIIDFFKDTLNIIPESKIADVGSGTGIFSELLLKNNFTVFAVEPNHGMRKAAENLLGRYPDFNSINGSAENTGLQVKSMDAITSAQAFHWFNPDNTKAEFKRILKENCYLALIWNSRNNDASPFMTGYEKLLLNLSIDYSFVNHTNINKETFDKFFSSYDKVIFPNKQTFDFEGLKGRLLSSSYAPDENSPGHVPMINSLENLFRNYENNGTVDFIYDTEVYFGKL